MDNALRNVGLPVHCLAFNERTRVRLLMETVSDFITTQEHGLFIYLRSDVMTPANNSNLEPS